MSLAGKQARAEQLRGELSALRLARENANLETHNAQVESKVDDEIAMLEEQVRAEQEQLTAATGDGSAADAIRAMYAADPSTAPTEGKSVEDAPAEEVPTEEAPASANPSFDLGLVVDGTSGEEK